MHAINVIRLKQIKGKLVDRPTQGNENTCVFPERKSERDKNGKKWQGCLSSPKQL